MRTELDRLNTEYQDALEDHRVAKEALRLAEELVNETRSKRQQTWEALCALWPHMKFDPPWSD